MMSNLLYIIYNTKRPYSTSCTNNVISEVYPYYTKNTYYLTYAQYKEQYASFFLDIYSTQIDNYSYLLKVNVNDTYVGAFKLTNQYDWGVGLMDIFSFHNVLSSSIIKLEVMHCENWELKCPKHLLLELRSTNPKGSHIRSKLRKYFYKFKPVPGP